MEEQRKLERMQRLLQGAVHNTHRVLHVQCGNPWIEECEEEYFIAVRLSRDCGEKDHIRKCACSRLIILNKRFSFFYS